MFVLEYPQKQIATYWGTIQTLFETDEYTCKRIKMNPNTQSSLEYHVKKTETYYIESGSLTVGLREGRGVNKQIKLTKGEILTIYPGQAHMRIAGDSHVIILEVSTKEQENDTFFIEDGKTYKHIVEEI